MLRKLTFLILTATALTLSAQGYGGPQPVSTRTTKVNYEKNHITVDISLQYPYMGPMAAIATLRDSILSDLAELAHPYAFEDIEMQTKPSSFDGAAEAVKDAFVKYAEADQRKICTDENGRYTPPSGEDAWMLNREFTADLTKEFSNLRFVTMRLETSIYLGGAHPGNTLFFYTADSQTGKLLTAANIFKHESLPALQRLIRQKILTEYADGEDIFFEEGNDLPIPATHGVALGEKGVIIQYQSYEVAPYVAGQPACLLPYSEIKNSLTPLALKLIGN